MIETVLATVALGLLSGCPSTIPSNSIDIPQPNIKGKTKTKTKQTKKKKTPKHCTNVYFFSLRVQGTPASALCTYCTGEE